MFWNLLWKDLKRARNNPWPFLINLAIPLAITAAIGLTFGPSSKGDGQPLPKIRLAVVDEDDSLLSQFIWSAFTQGDAEKFFDPVAVNRDEAQAMINRNELSAILIIPKDFTDKYLFSEQPPPLELIKNPAQSYLPGIVEELALLLAEGLDALKKVFGPELRQWMETFDGEEMPAPVVAGQLMEKTAEKVKALSDYLFPPLITYEQVAENGAPKEERPGFNIFGYLIPMIGSMFFLFMADASVRDIYKEQTGKTFTRFRTLRSDLFPFVLSKIMAGMVFVVIGAVILFGGAMLIFSIQWKSPVQMLGLIGAYGVCASGLLSCLAAVAKTERRADALNPMIIFGFAFLGGSMIQADQLPEFVVTYISPMLPNYWFIQGVHQLQFDSGAMPVGEALVKLLVTGLVLAAAASILFRKSLEKGGAA